MKTMIVLFIILTILATIGILREQKLGGITTISGVVSLFDILTERVCINKVCHEYLSQDFVNATSTLCSYPIKATSTLLGIDVRQNFATGTKRFIISSSTNRYSSTTPLHEQTVQSGEVLTYSSTNTFDGKIWFPGQFINVTADGFIGNLSGKCNFVLRDL